MPRVELNGVNVHYQQAGRGPDLVMIHGLFSNLAFWYLTVLPVLARDFRVTVYDLRGHGYSAMPKQGYTSFDLAGDLHALLNHLDVERAHIVGHSFGGAVALHYALLHPERVASLTEADGQVPSLQQPLPARNAVRWKRAAARLRRAGFDVPDDLPVVAFGFLEELARVRGQRTQDYAPVGAAVGALNASSRVRRRWRELVRTTTAATEFTDASGLTPDRIREVKQPALAIFGERSWCVPTLRGLERNLSHCTKVVVPGAGHFFPVFQPDVLVRNVRRFVAEVGL